MFATLAGYDPCEAIPFLQRIVSATCGVKPPGFLNTFPPVETCNKKMNRKMPEALKYCTG